MNRARRMAACAALLGLALATGRAGQTPDPIVLGEGAQRYEWVRGWAKLPEGVELGNTHGCVLVDAADRVYLNTDSERAIAVFDREGNYLRSIGTDLAGGLHGMTLVHEAGAAGAAGRDVLYLAHLGRHEALKIDLDGNVLWRAGYPESSGLYQSAEQYLPTSVAVAPDGRFFVADGYGLYWIHRYDAAGKYLGSFGGRGKDPGKLGTPHGLWVDARGERPLLIEADRGNRRLQRFDLEGRLVDVLPLELRLPCHMSAGEGYLVVPELEGRVTILDRSFAVIAHLGEGADRSRWGQNGIPREEWRDGEFIAPHCAAWDSHGDLYVADWLAQGRISKLRRLR